MLIIAQAVQNTASTGPDWLKYLGSAGALGLLLATLKGLDYFLVNGRIRPLEERIKNLTIQLEDLKDKLKNSASEKKDIEENISHIYGVLGSLTEKYTPQEAAKLRVFLDRLQSAFSSDSDVARECESAAAWVLENHNRLVKIGYTSAVKKYKKTFRPFDFILKKRFQSDMENYLKWVYKSLSFYKTPHNEALMQFVGSPCIKSPDPYKTALQEIPYKTALQEIKLSLERDKGDLSLQELARLEKILDALIKKI